VAHSEDIAAGGIPKNILCQWQGAFCTQRVCSNVIYAIVAAAQDVLKGYHSDNLSGAKTVVKSACVNRCKSGQQV